MDKTLNKRGLPDGYQLNEELEITPRQVKRMLDNEDDFVFIDCRKPEEQDIAKIQGTKLIPIQETNNHKDFLETCKDKKVVIHCHAGGRSMKMTQLLKAQGFEDVKSMAGGVDLWAIDIDPTLKRY